MPAPVTWTNLTNSTLAAGNELLASVGGYAAGGSSVETLAASTLGYVEVIAKTTGYGDHLWGMGTTGTGGGYARINFALEFIGAQAIVFELGVLKQTGQPLALSDVFRITRFADGHVEMSKNAGAPFYTSATNNTALMYANGGASASSGQLQESITLNGFGAAGGLPFMMQQELLTGGMQQLRGM